tara:strand:- start:3160 stop:4311 length:1152 start_codon:yes stop_codon:yes gene_type:complete
MKISLKIIFFSIVVILICPKELMAKEKIKIGLLVPLSGNQSYIGKSIVQSTRLAINKIDNNNIEIIPKNSKNNPEETLAAAKQLAEEGVKIVIGPVFNKNLIHLDQLNDMIFLSLTNKNIKNSKNIISVGINAHSQIKTIMKFKEMQNITKTLFLIPDSDFKEEIKAAISRSKIKLKHIHIYETNPTKLTKQIEEITLYQIRKQNVLDEIKRLENSNEENKEWKIKNLKKRDTIGGINFDSVIVSDFEEGLKSVFTSLLYTDVSPQRVYYITLNQWFDENFLKEESLHPLYFPSINKENYDYFISSYKKVYNENPNQLAFLSYDIVGLVYYLLYQNNFEIDEKIFYKKNQFKGKVGIFEINKNIVNHILNFYKIENKEFKKIF